MAEEASVWTWKHVVAQLRDEPIDTVVRIALSDIEEPSSAGLQPMPSSAEGRPVFGAVLDEQTGFLVQVCSENYEARFCRLPQAAASSPSSSPAASATPPTSSPPALRHPTEMAPPAPSAPVVVQTRTELVVSQRREPASLMTFPSDQPGTTMLATSLLGALLGLAIDGPRGAAWGAGIGAGVGLASIAVSTAATSPATAQIASTMFLALAAASLGGGGRGRVLRLGPMPPRRLPPWEEDDGSPRPRRPRKK